MTKEELLTPQELAAELGVPVKNLRAWLRKVEMRPEDEKGQRWELTTEEADFVRHQFSQRQGAFVKNK